MLVLLLFIGSIVVGIYFLLKKIENEKNETFEDRDN
jgi:hypothetical protein